MTGKNCVLSVNYGKLQRFAFIYKKCKVCKKIKLRKIVIYRSIDTRLMRLMKKVTYFSHFTNIKIDCDELL